MSTTLTNPAPDSTLKGNNVQISATCDDLSITGINFFVDNVQIGVKDTTSPYSVVFDSTTVPDGSHEYKAVCSSSTNTQARVRSYTNNSQSRPVTQSTSPWIVNTAPASGDTFNYSLFFGFVIALSIGYFVVKTFYNMYIPKGGR